MRTMAIAAGIGMLVGCTSSAPPSQSLGDVQEQILKDPMGYQPQMNRDISGGDINRVGNGMDKDVNDILNP